MPLGAIHVRCQAWCGQQRHTHMLLASSWWWARSRVGFYPSSSPSLPVALRPRTGMCRTLPGGDEPLVADGLGALPEELLQADTEEVISDFKQLQSPGTALEMCPKIVPQRRISRSYEYVACF